jgi:hypothetical protein
LSESPNSVQIYVLCILAIASSKLQYTGVMYIIRSLSESAVIVQVYVFDILAIVRSIQGLSIKRFLSTIYMCMYFVYWLLSAVYCNIAEYVWNMVIVRITQYIFKVCTLQLLVLLSETKNNAGRGPSSTIKAGKSPVRSVKCHSD